MSLHESTTLVFLHVSQWGARRHDKAASLQVAAANDAGDAGRFNKLLIDKAHLAEIGKAVSAMRVTHYDLTLPWQDDGARLLPNALFMKYAEAMRVRRQAFDDAVRSFVAKYPELVTQARKRLGKLYQPADYPVDISGRFQSRLEFAPMPNVDDFRVKASEAEAELIKFEVTASVNSTLATRQAEAMKHVNQRVRDALERVRDRCSAEKPIIHDSMMEEIETLIDVLPAMNIVSDPKIDELVHRLKNEVLCSTSSLRRTKAVRLRAAEGAEELLSWLT